jgi:hypothetical protein
VQGGGGGLGDGVRQAGDAVSPCSWQRRVNLQRRRLRCRACARPTSPSPALVGAVEHVAVALARRARADVAHRVAQPAGAAHDGDWRGRVRRGRAAAGCAAVGARRRAGPSGVCASGSQAKAPALPHSPNPPPPSPHPRRSAFRSSASARRARTSTAPAPRRRRRRSGGRARQSRRWTGWGGGAAGGSGSKGAVCWGTRGWRGWGAHERRAAAVAAPGRHNPRPTPPPCPPPASSHSKPSTHLTSGWSRKSPSERRRNSPSQWPEPSSTNWPPFSRVLSRGRGWVLAVVVVVVARQGLGRCLRAVWKRPLLPSAATPHRHPGGAEQKGAPPPAPLPQPHRYSAARMRWMPFWGTRRVMTATRGLVGDGSRPRPWG